MSTADLIGQRLAALDPLQFDLRDDSALHAGHAGAREGGGHFTLTIVSDAFTGLSRAERHRRVYTLLGDLIPQTIHALSIRALAPEER